ncbi:hypothetical protein APHAL10511_004886 [Amanita phalloides]|nr:hypothetical protein APHAL10511_004886 [Amanita phalloides]
MLPILSQSPFYSPPQSGPSRRRKPDRACDACRRKKTKCDGPKLPNNHCSNCVQVGKPCTYVESSKPRGPPKAYVIGLENRMEKLEALLQQLYPDVDFSHELGPPVIRDSWRNKGEAQQQVSRSDIPDTTQPLRSAPEYHPDDMKTPLHLLPGPSLSCKRRILDELDSDSPASGENHTTSSDSEPLPRPVATALTLRGTGEHCDIAEDPRSVRFHGRTSVQGIVDATRKYRQMLLKQSGNSNVHTLRGHLPDNNLMLYRDRRPEFWQTPKWELAWETYQFDSISFMVDVLARFPPLELARHLISLYFERVNNLYPLLHRPTFERQFNDRLYERDIWFAGACHSMFAIASKYSDDPRVLPQNAKTPNGVTDWGKAGWDFFNMALDITRVRRSLFLPATLFEIQAHIILSLFLRSSSAYAVSWLLVAVGLCKAQDVGAHRKKMYRDKPSVDGELWKRAYWLLVLSDVFVAAYMGRSGSTSPEDFDLDLPLEVDDEYWETDDPEMAFKQPQGVPSRITAFNYLLKIGYILSFAQKTLYGINKFASFVPKSWDRAVQVMKDIKTALDDWFQALPAHLKWSEDMKKSPFAKQSAMLTLVYYISQIIVHRPFVQQPSDSFKQEISNHIFSYSDKALTESTAAARSIVHILQNQEAQHFLGAIVDFCASYYAAGQLLLEVWRLKSQGKAQGQKKGNVSNEDDSRSQEINDLLADVYTVRDMYERAKVRWEYCRPLLERLEESLPKGGEMPQPDIWYQMLSTSRAFTPQSYSEESTTNSPASTVQSPPYMVPGMPPFAPQDPYSAYSADIGIPFPDGYPADQSHYRLQPQLNSVLQYGQGTIPLQRQVWHDNDLNPFLSFDQGVFHGNDYFQL